MPSVVIMPVLAHPPMTQRACESVLAQDLPGGVELMAIDNGSTDGCGSYLRSLDPQRTSYVAYASPRSLNLVWNRALCYVFDYLRHDYVLVCNNDLVLHPATLRLLVADGGPFVTAVGTDKHDQAVPDVPSRRPHPDFSCFLIRRECWETVGEFDTRYWAYASDCSYHLRMERAGIKAVSLSIPFFHESSGTLKYAAPAMRDFICRKADEDRKTFQLQYGFAAGSPEYYAQFSSVAPDPPK